MFTGIIEDIGSIASITKSGGKWEFHVKTVLADRDLREGDSIAIDGVCLTATRIGDGGFYADASLETLSVTTLTEKKTGTKVNVERAMSPDGRFGGHFVMGHVDAIGIIVDMRKAGDSVRISIEIPPDISRYIVKKGSVAIDGISLTVNDQKNNIFTVNVIPFTVSKTTLGEKNPRDKVNIETDIVGKYIESFLAKGENKGVDLDFLYEHGYIKGD
ncbi:MAG: riboflavin synthase [Syntrophorhabdus aromaticivorans]|uniref:Riboflavin synthase n=1 Tax=Syntrophorhabdus aromaticivorans TaxID=328301 RepID=A0A971M3X2_9BACT|nr:riboflavin synthase [Syntrophorhabdus aromaticivorans]